MARSSSKKAPGSLRMTISGTATEMARIKDVATARGMHVTRLIHDAVADYEKNSATDSAPSDPVDSQNPKGGGTKATESALSYVHGDDIDDIKSSLSEIIARQAQAAIDAKATAKGLDDVPKQLDEVLQILTTLSQAVHR